MASEYGSWLLTFAVLAVVAKLVDVVFVRPLRYIAHYRAQGVPGMPFVPGVGNLPTIIRARQAPNPYESDLAMYHPFVRGGLGYIFVGTDFQLRIHDAELMQEVFVTHATAFEKPALVMGILVPILGRTNLLLLNNGETHSRHRKVISPAFHFLRLRDMAASMSAAASRAVDAWLAPLPPSAAGGGGGAAPPHVDLDVHAALTALTLGVIGEAAFGVRLDDESGGDAAAAATVSPAALAGLISSAFDAAFQLTALIPGYNAVLDARRAPAVASLRAALLRVLEARLAARRAEAAAGRDADAADAARPRLLIDCLLDATAAAPPAAATGGAPVAPLTLAEVLDEAMTFVFAGHETTSHALCWTVYHLAQHPAWAAAARAEVLRVVGPTRAPVYDDLAALPTVAAVLHESMRLMPAVVSTVRVATRDVTLRRKPPVGGARPAAAGGAPDPASLAELHVKAGTVIGLGLAAVQRDPALWGATAADFDPQRFMAGVAAAAPHPLAYAPFTAGPRSCIGQHFALLEARLVLATLLQRAELELAPEYVHCPLQFVTLTPKHGMPLRLRRRRDAVGI